MAIGILAAIVGNTLINYVVRKYRKTWFVIAILAAVILLSTILLGYTGFFRTLRSYLQVFPAPRMSRQPLASRLLPCTVNLSRAHAAPPALVLGVLRY
jgi:hypothetical protein